MEQILGKRSNRGRSTEYAALIKELLQEVEKLTLENQTLRKQLEIVTVNGKETAQRMTGVMKEREDLQAKLKGQQEQAANEKLMVALDMANKEGEISRLQQENMRLNELTLELKRDKHAEKNIHNEEVTSLKREINGLKQTIEQYEDQKQRLMREIEQKDSIHMMEVDQLRKINSIIKKNFQIMEEDYDALLKLTQESPTPTLTYRRQPSRPKKVPSLKKIKPSAPNPEMEQELWLIKQQVSDQMTRMTLGRELASKNRVDRTLATLQSLLTEISQRVEQSDCESGHE